MHRTETASKGHAHLPSAGASVAARPLPARWEAVRPYVLSLPALLVVIGVLVPFVQAIYFSLHRYNLAFPMARRFVGLENFVQLAQSPEFLQAVRITILYTLWALAIELSLGLLIAVLLHKDNWVTRVLTALLVLPLMVPPSIGALMWKLMTNPVFGIVNWFLSFVGARHFPWASDPRTALLTVVMVDVWIYTPFMAVLLLAGLRALPQQPFEAARLDNAPFFFTFRNLTLPLLSPYIVTAVLFRMLDSLQQFDIIYSMTQGGPGGALMNFQVRAYLEAFQYLNISRSATFLLLLWAMTFLISQVLVSYWNRLRVRLKSA